MRTLLAFVVALTAAALPSVAWAAPADPPPPGAAGSPCCAPPPPPCASSVCCPGPSADPCCVAGVRWHLSVGMWVWGLDGTVGDNGREVDVDSDWTDTLENLDKIEFAIDLRARAEWGRWRFSAGFDGATLEDSLSAQQGAFAVDAEVSLWTAYAQLGYVIAGGRMGCDACAPTWCLDAYAGARFYATSLELSGTPGPAPNAVDSSEEWIDPLVGLHLAIQNRKWTWVFEGDVGGFGVGSDFAWSALASVGYNFTRGFGIAAGWKVLDIDREDGGFIFDAQLSGPFVALTFTF